MTIQLASKLLLIATLGGTIYSSNLCGSSYRRMWKSPQPIVTVSKLEFCEIDRGFVADLLVDWVRTCEHVAQHSSKIFYYRFDPMISDLVPLPDGVYRYPDLVIPNSASFFDSWFPDLASCAMPTEVKWHGICEIRDQ